MKFQDFLGYLREIKIVHLGLVDYLKRNGFKVFLGVFLVGFILVVAKNYLGPQQKTIKVGAKKVKVEVVKKTQDRLAGLAGRDSICQDCGMLFLFPQPGFHSIWMKGMKFDIDIIWIAAGKVVGITPYVPYPAPTATYFPTYQPPQAVDAVLEVPSGWSLGNGIRVGDMVKY